jgi:hypothetical protein
MAVYIVTYDLNKESVRPNITKRIRDTYPSWAKLSESSYAIETQASPQQVVDALKPLIDSNDNLYVITLKRPYAGYGPPDVNEWLEQRLTW